MNKFKLFLIFILLIITTTLFYLDFDWDKLRKEKTKIEGIELLLEQYKKSKKEKEKTVQPLTKILSKNKDSFLRIDSLLNIMKIKDEWIEDTFYDSIWLKKLTVPTSLSALSYHRIICNIFSDLDIKINSTTEHSLSNSFVYKFTIKDNLCGKLIVKRSYKVKENYFPFGRIALVIDDFGNQWQTDYIQGYIDFPVPITLSIIPGHWASNRTAKKAKEYGKEVMIHFPMQPYSGNITTEKVYLTTDMKSKKIKRMLLKSFDNIPYAKGLNNHEGSKATSDPGSMNRFFSIFKNYDLFFLNSLTSGKTVAKEYALRDSVPYLQRNIFLDDIMSREEITKKFKQVVKRALRGEDVIAIGHTRKLTYTVLKELIDNEFGSLTYVFASQLLDKNK